MLAGGNWRHFVLAVVSFGRYHNSEVIAMSKTRSIPRSELEKLYVEEGLTIQETARRLNASEHTVRRNLKEKGLHIQTNSEIHTKHGMTGTRPYRIWLSLRNRCNNPNHSDYRKYGAKGISYPERWDDFEVFWKEMNDGYDNDKTIDRIDGTKSYSIENCRWASYVDQNKNKSTNVKIAYNGKIQLVIDWARELGLPFSTLYRRKRDGWPDREVIEGKHRAVRI